MKHESCEICGETEEYCGECNTCHKCVSEEIDRLKGELEDAKRTIEDVEASYYFLLRD